MSEAEAEAILARMDPKRAAEARELIRYPSDVAGGLMVTELLAYPETAAVQDVLKGLSDWVEARPEEDAHVHVVSSTGILIGGLDLRGLVLTRRTTPLSDTMIAVSLGGTVPLLLKHFKIDPPVASGPILTTVTDMCGFFLVLGLATVFLPKLTMG